MRSNYIAWAIIHLPAEPPLRGPNSTVSTLRSMENIYMLEVRRAKD